MGMSPQVSAGKRLCLSGFTTMKPASFLEEEVGSGAVRQTCMGRLDNAQGTHPDTHFCRA